MAKSEAPQTKVWGFLPSRKNTIAFIPLDKARGFLRGIKLDLSEGSLCTFVSRLKPGKKVGTIKQLAKMGQVPEQNKKRFLNFYGTVPINLVR